MIAVDYKHATKCVIKSKIWFNIGKLIFLISGGSNEGYELWMRYSSYDKNFEEVYCYELWSNFDEIMPEDFKAFDFEEEPEDLPNGW